MLTIAKRSKGLKHMKTILYSIAFVLIININFVGATSPIIVGGELDYPPYSFLDENNQPTGFQTDLCRSIGNVMGMDIEIRLTAWAKVRESLENGTIDLISGMFYSNERAKIYDFSPPYTIVSSVIFARKNSIPVKSIDELKNKEIIVMRGEAMHDYVIKHKLTHKLILCETPGDVLQKLSSGLGDYALGAQMPGLYWIKKLGLSNVITMGKPLKPFKNCFSVKKGNTLLLSRFIEGLMILYQTGEYQKLYNKWFDVLKGGRAIVLKDILKHIAMVFIPLISLLALVFIWSWMLRKTVASRTRELMESQKQIKTLSDNLPRGYVYQLVFEENNRFFKYISAGVEQMHGFLVKDIMNDPNLLYQQIVEEDRNYLIEQESISRTSLSHFYVEVRYRTSDGEIRWMILSSSPRRITDQSVVSDGVAIDITPRKQFEKELINEKERLLVTLRSIGDGVIATDIQGKIVLMNKVGEELTGWSQQEAKGKPISKIFYIINEQTRQICENPIEKVLETGKIAGLANNTLLISRDGSERIIADSGAPIQSHDGHIIGVILVFRDITHQKHMEDEMQRSQKIESIGLLAGGIAHDFNNVLSVISGNISYALSIINENDEIHRVLDDVQTGTKQAQQLTQQLLTFSKGGDPIKRIADIRKVLKESALFVTSGSKVRCDFDFSDDLWIVSLDTGQINQAITNIVINASQAMPDGGIIRIKAENIIIESEDNNLLLPQGNYVKISIEDSGTGIPENNISRIFDPYFTTKPKGSGLGLATTYSIIHNHHGKITLESSLGKGTIFYIYLPAKNIKPDIDPKEVAIQHKGHGKILVMDDQEMILNMVARLLNRMGYETVFANDGQQAIDIYKKAFLSENPFVLVLLDLTIPGGMGGAETIAELLKIDPDIKAVVSSGYSNDPIMASYKDYGFSGVIAKPYTRKELAKTLESIHF